MSQQRHRPDLRLADSYIPAIVLMIKIFFYTLMVPFFLHSSEFLQPIVVSIFLIVLYVDHIYLCLQSNAFLDTTVVSVDIVASTLYMLLCSSACSVWCFAILGSWGLTSVSYILVINAKLTFHEMHRKIVHLVAFFFFACFISTRSDDTEESIILHFFTRSLFYTLLVLVDAYFIRPPFLLESDRYFMCKFGAILFAPCHLSVILFGGLLLAQIMVVSLLKRSPEETTVEKIDANHSVELCDNGSVNPQLLSLMSININMENIDELKAKVKDEPSNVAEMDVMEAFRIAKQQYASHHGLKIN
jgi:hypothetical protein